MRVVLTIASLLLSPLGVVDQTLGRFDRDTLQPVGPVLEAAETHTRPVLGPCAKRFAIGLSSPGEPGIPASGRGRVGLWIVDAQAMRVERQIRAGIAAEAVVFPGMVAAVLQDGALIVVDPDDGRIVSRRQVGFTFGNPSGVHAGGRGVMVNEVRRGRVEVVVVSASGAVRTKVVRLPGVGRSVGLTADGRRAYIAGGGRLAVLDPATMRVTVRRIDADARSAAVSGGSLAVAGPRGLRVYDTATWRLLARDTVSREVFAEAGFVAGGSGRVTALDESGKERWRAAGSVAAVAAGRVYATPAVLDLQTGERVGTHPRTNTLLRLVSG